MSEINTQLFRNLWNEDNLKAEVTEFFGEFDPLKWSLDAGTHIRFEEYRKAGKSVEDYYRDEVGFVYQSAWNCATNDERTKYMSMLQFALENRLMEALDYGCGIGSGVFTLALGGLTYVTAADICKPNLDFVNYRLKKYSEQTEIDLATIIKIKDLANSKSIRKKYDLIVCTEVFEHVDDPKGLAESLNGYLKPGGYAIYSWSFVPMPTHLEEHFHLQATHPDKVTTEGFGSYLTEELGMQFIKWSWFNNMIWRKPE